MTRQRGQRRHRSPGDVISTCVFAVMGLWLAGTAMTGTGALWRDGIVWCASIASLAGALRFQIARLAHLIRSNDR
ncbi:hypothetical protein ACVDG3_14845 [Meridianimarinicoccus sp. RP-17]|uniref:hypothetical protein n=1 Tax=Meridianimarinicoccus zhengii TaxID=2056810 RepID=UPI000DAF03EE|nr:hypothetical protein [Phycocomes zhengii]